MLSSNVSFMSVSENFSYFTDNLSYFRENVISKAHTVLPFDQQDVPQNDFFPVYIAVAALLTSLLHYALNVASFTASANAQGKLKRPPVVPHAIPFLGSIPLDFWWNPRNFVLNNKYVFWSQHPVKVRLLFNDVYILQGAKNILALFKQHALSAFVLHGSLLRYVFRLPESAVGVYYKDDSGEHPKPHRDSSVEHRNRVDFLTRSSFQRFLTGPGFAPLSQRFQKNITERFSKLDVGAGWTQWDDLISLFHHDLTSAAIDSMCGKHLLSSNPNFTNDFWTLDHNVMTLFTRTPWFMASKIYQARDSALAAVKSWQSWAREHFTEDSVGADGDDPFWGTKFFRERQGMFYQMDGFNADAVASQELAFIWGANTNAIVSAFWCTLETFKDADLLKAVRAEAASCIKTHTATELTFDVERLLRQPIMQAIYAETLRLRVNGFLVRCPLKGDLKINDYSIPKNHFILTSSTPGQMDPKVWSTGANSAHPPNEFWPGRFLKHVDDAAEPSFSLAGTEGSWMPFGGGTHTCPGKNFAKLEILLTMALMVTLYDVEITATKEDVEMSPRNFGFGTLSPKGKIPVNIRRRKVVHFEESL